VRKKIAGKKWRMQKLNKSDGGIYVLAGDVGSINISFSIISFPEK
jgi:hypothetical protein